MSGIQNAGTEIVTAAPSIANPGAMIFLINSDAPLLDDMTLMAVCADLPPLRYAAGAPRTFLTVEFRPDPRPLPTRIRPGHRQRG